MGVGGSDGTGRITRELGGCCATYSHHSRPTQGGFRAGRTHEGGARPLRNHCAGSWTARRGVASHTSAGQREPAVHVIGGRGMPITHLESSSGHPLNDDTAPALGESRGGAAELATDTSNLLDGRRAPNSQCQQSLTRRSTRAPTPLRPTPNPGGFMDQRARGGERKGPNGRREKRARTAFSPPPPRTRHQPHRCRRQYRRQARSRQRACRSFTRGTMENAAAGSLAVTEVALETSRVARFHLASP